MKDYAAKVQADLVLIQDVPACNFQEHDPTSCGKRSKLQACSDLLGYYERVLVLDDTILIRR